MDYYYDVTLNFDLEQIWKFYEWENDDGLIRVKKIPLFHVSLETICDFLNYELKIAPEFYQLIVGKTECKSREKFTVACLISDGKNAYGVLFDEHGVVKSVSPLLIKEELSVNEYMYTIRKTVIPYTILKKRILHRKLRYAQKLQNFILVELNTLLDEKRCDKLAYFYYEWFLKEEENMEKMYQDMVFALQTSSYEQLSYLSYLIRLSYHQV